jgi:HemY protein
MRALFAFLLLAVLAVLFALLFKHNAGYALFVAPPYRVELSLNAFILFVLGGFAALYLLLRLSARIARMPQEVRDARRRRNVERARGKQDSAVVALLEGRYGKARQFADEALAIPQSSGLSALVAARASIDTHEFDMAESYLGRADAGVGSLAVPRLMLTAEAALERGQPGEALTRLGELKREAGLHTAALRLEMQQAIEDLRATKFRRLSINSSSGRCGRRRAATSCAPAHMRRHCWRIAARCGGLCAPTGIDAVRHGQAQLARRACRSGQLSSARRRSRSGGDHRPLSRPRPDPNLTTLYAQCRTPEATRQLETAEHWPPQHSQDPRPSMRSACVRAGAPVGAKSQTYFEASLAPRQPLKRTHSHWANCIGG